MSEFEVMVHLGGEQNLPSLLMMRAIKAEKHIILVTDRSREKNSFLKDFYDDDCLKKTCLYLYHEVVW